MELYGRVAQLGEHLLCKHVFISPKSLNRRLLTVQNPPLVGLLNGLQMIDDLLPEERPRLAFLQSAKRLVVVIPNLKTRRPGNSKELPGCFPFSLLCQPLDNHRSSPRTPFLAESRVADQPPNDERIPGL
jgi:hypothetical protein